MKTVAGSIPAFGTTCIGWPARKVAVGMHSDLGGTRAQTIPRGLGSPGTSNPRDAAFDSPAGDQIRGRWTAPALLKLVTLVRIQPAEPMPL